MKYKVGTRGSKLALAQTYIVIDQLKKKYPEDDFEIVIIKTTGDRNMNTAIDTIGSKGVFVDEIEKALLEGKIHLAVHSMKDMPAELEQGLVFSKAVKRADARDVLISREAKTLDELREGAIIGTGSKRRAFQLKRMRPDIEIVDIRGNIDTRIKKLQEPMPDGRYMDGLILAAAGLHRLKLEDKITQYFSPQEMIPAPCQGVLAIEMTEGNEELLQKINAISDDDTQRAVTAERNFLKKTGGDCHLPIGAYLDTTSNIFYSLFGNEDGSILEIKSEKYE
ncbi:MAG: hydroxymethylbilane synthase [Lachnospiraceae bacterium]